MRQQPLVPSPSPAVPLVPMHNLTSYNRNVDNPEAKALDYSHGLNVGCSFLFLGLSQGQRRPDPRTEFKETVSWREATPCGASTLASAR